MEHLDYLKWFLYFCWIPTVVIWVFYWRLLVRYWKVFIYCMLGSIIFGWAWDYWATHFWLWHFSPQHTLNIVILGLPIEEFIFFTTETMLYASLALVLRQRFIKGRR